MRRSPLLPIFLTVFVDVLGLTLVLPLLPFYAEHFGASPLIVGLLTASYAACMFIAGPILGRLSDRIGRRPTLLWSQAGTLVGFLILASANHLWLLFLGRMIDGTTAGNLTIAQAYISDVTRPEQRTKAFGMIGVAFGLGFLLGPAISGALAGRFGYSAPLFLAAALSATALTTTWALLKEPPRASGPTSPPPSSALWELLRRPLPRRRLLEFFAFATAFSTLIGGLAMFLERQLSFNVERTGYVYAASGLVGAVVQGLLLGRLVGWLGEPRLAQLGFLAMACGYAAIGFVSSVPALLLVVLVTSLGSAIVRPCLTTLLTQSVGASEQGWVLGASQSLQSLAQIGGPVLAGALIEHHMLVTYGLAAAAAAAIGFLLGTRPSPATTPVQR